jgi:beta-lactamase regulating signal transducer with metallopeptidase domain
MNGEMTMDKLFLTILNMSLTGSFVIAAIIIARIPLKQAPKIISYCIWTVVGFRLVSPFSIDSIFSLIPFKAQPIPTDIAIQSVPRIDSGITVVNNVISNALPVPALGASGNPLQIWTAVGSFVWFFGVAVMLVYGVVSFIVLKRKMREATYAEANIYETENIKSPFVLGIFSPRIYIPVGLSAQERGYIILHEQTHIRRRDHIVKFAAYFILCLHWFNPLVWAAFLLMSADMEMSCDERVLKETGDEIKREYSLSLLSLATERSIIGGSPLAFGEGGVKERIKNVLNFKKPSRVIIVAAVTLVVVLSICFAVDRVKSELSEFSGTYYLENPTEKQKFERLLSVTLYDDGTAMLATPPISSYILPKCAYTVEGDELLISAVIKTKSEEEFYGVKNRDVIARFVITDDKILVFQSADVPVFADSQARYIYAPFSLVSYETREWLNYFHDEQMPWGDSLELELPEYPDTVFRWTPYEVKVINSSSEKTLFTGMPIWNVYLADLTGDGQPEFCATVSFGSGIVDTRVVVYDYAAGKLYDLSDRMYYDYVLSIKDGRLVVKQSEYNGAEIATGDMSITDGVLTVIGINRAVKKAE